MAFLYLRCLDDFHKDMLTAPIVTNFINQKNVNIDDAPVIVSPSTPAPSYFTSQKSNIF
jgi:hypothetical protein